MFRHRSSLHCASPKDSAPGSVRVWSSEPPCGRRSGAGTSAVGPADSRGRVSQRGTWQIQATLPLDTPGGRADGPWSPGSPATRFRFPGWTRAVWRLMRHASPAGTNALADPMKTLRLPSRTRMSVPVPLAPIELRSDAQVMDGHHPDDLDRWPSSPSTPPCGRSRSPRLRLGTWWPGTPTSGSERCTRPVTSSSPRSSGSRSSQPTSAAIWSLRFR